MGAAFVVEAALISDRLRQHLENRKACSFRGRSGARCALLRFFSFPSLSCHASLLSCFLPFRLHVQLGAFRFFLWEAD